MKFTLNVPVVNEPYIGKFTINLKPRSIQVLGDTFSRAPHITLNSAEALSIDFDNATNGY